MISANFASVHKRSLGDWIGVHTRALTFIGGVPRLIGPDNAKVVVIKAYEPRVDFVGSTRATVALHGKTDL
jgi:transposase